VAAIKERSNASLAAANHLLEVTHASKSGKNLTSEQSALILEKEKKTVQDRNAQLATERKASGEQIASQQDTANKLAASNSATNSALMDEQKFNKSFELARSQFSSDESEIYRRGDQLIIRLKTLEFPVNQAVLRGSNFSVLAKVSNVIKGFENSKVTIEGHTDSDGGKSLNKKLSMERAEAVSEYLVSNQAVPQDRIEAVGFGFDRALATNKTAKGKAENRRVDIVISPELIKK
jgi:OOP family OmpA-OmpF porin